MEGERSRSLGMAPDLPDTKQCCRERNVSSTECVEQFCDPVYMAEAGVKAMITCAPWAKDMFDCLTDLKDHRPCCATRGVSEKCMELCGPQVSLSFKGYSLQDTVLYLSRPNSLTSPTSPASVT